MVGTRRMRKFPQLTHHEIPPPEVITEILYRLPAKSVGRFRCVSKGWLSLLTDPQFIKTHTQNTLNQHHLIFESQFGYYPERSYFLYSHPLHELVVTTSTKFNLELDLVGVEEIVFSSSCHGLVLVRVDCEGTCTLLLVNPTTRENMQLPEDYYYKVREMDNVVELETDIMCGFGYDSVTDDYKVVALTYYNYYESDEEDADRVEGVYVYVYSLRNKTWMRVIDSPYIHYRADGVFVNGFIHWIVNEGRSHDNLLVIAAFSLADESFSEVPSPKSYDVTNMSNRHYCQLIVLGGKLAIFQQKKGEIWLMNEYGVRESWTKISLHGINKIPIFKPEPYTIPKPLVMDHNAKILVANSDRMMVYEVEKGTFSETACVWNPNKLLVLGSYVESLVSLKHNVTKQKSTNSSKEKEKEEDAEDEDVENEDVEDDPEDEGEEDACKGEENTHPERQTRKRKDIGSSNAPLKHIHVNSYSWSSDIPEPSRCELLDPELIQHRLEGVVPLHFAQEDLGISNGDLCHRADTYFFNILHSFEAIRQNLQATGHVVDTLSRDIKEKNVMILDLERKVSQDYDSWKAKHQEEKLRADRLEGEVNHALSKQKFLNHRPEENEATIQSKLVEIQVFERRAREQEFTLVEKNEELLEKCRALDTANAEIESLKARLAMADQERRKAIAALQSW